MDLDCSGCGEPVYVPTTDELASEGTEARCACGAVSQVQCEDVVECDCEEEDCLHAGQGYRAYDPTPRITLEGAIAARAQVAQFCQPPRASEERKGEVGIAASRAYFRHCR